MQRYSGQHEDLTLQDIYNKEGDFDSEDDSDWDPLEKQLGDHITIVKWFCINCTMVNFGDTIYCHVWSCFMIPALIFIYLIQNGFFPLSLAILFRTCFDFS